MNFWNKTPEGSDISDVDKITKIKEMFADCFQKRAREILTMTPQDFQVQKSEVPTEQEFKKGEKMYVAREIQRALNRFELIVTGGCNDLLREPHSLATEIVIEIEEWREILLGIATLKRQEFEIQTSK